MSNNIEKNNLSVTKREDEQPEVKSEVLLQKAASVFVNEEVFAKVLSLCCSSTGVLQLPEEERLPAMKSMLQTFAAFAPQDDAEGVLVSQYLALFEQGMKQLAGIDQVRFVESKNLYANMATKMFRSANETLDMLMKYRRKGEQRVIVQHVNVEEGGQAIVGGSIGMGRGRS